MNIEFSQCTINDKEVSLGLQFTSAFEEIQREVNKDSDYRHDRIPNAIVAVIAKQIAAEYMETHKMEIVAAISKEAIVNAIQLKIVEGFSLNR